MKVTYSLPALGMRQKVQALQDVISQLPQYEPETKHTFHAGMYCREVWRPAGVIVVGKIHKKEHFYLIVSGTVAITTDEGVKSITGPHLLCSKPGTWLQTSYNTRGNVYYLPDSNIPDPDQSKAFRGNYAGLGYTYDQVNDVFYAPKPTEGDWVLDTRTWLWVPA